MSEKEDFELWVAETGKKVSNWQVWQACAERKNAEIAALRELLLETQLFIDELPKDLGKGSLNGWSIQIIQKIIDKRGENER